jgi:hypothetical protein
MVGSVCINVFKQKNGRPHGTTTAVCPRPMSCPSFKTYKMGYKRQFCGQADKVSYIVQKHNNIRDKAILSERICARIENFNHLSKEKIDMREHQVEQKLVKSVKNLGGIAPKFVSPGFDGMPDRIVLLPEGRIAFVEVKAPGKKPGPLQLARHDMLRRLGFKVFVLDDTSQIGDILDEIRTT